MSCLMAALVNRIDITVWKRFLISSGKLCLSATSCILLATRLVDIPALQNR